MKKDNYLKFLLLILALLSSATVTAHMFEVDGIYYNIIGNKATVTYRGTSDDQYSQEYSGNITIPETVTYSGTIYHVTSIGASAFLGCPGLTSIVIPNSVTSIGNSAFSNCSGLTSIVIPNSVTSIGNLAFYACKGLTRVDVGNSVASIGNRAFINCYGLTSICVESGNAFYDSRDNCNAIIKTSSNTLIAGCKNTIIPNTVTSIGDDAFSNCPGLTNIVIPNSVTSIGDYAFAGTGLTSIVIPNSVTSIGNSAFISCKLTSIVIPNSVTSIGNHPFDTDLTSICVESGNAFYDSRDNCNAIIKTSSNTLIAGCKNTIIPNTVTSIGTAAFLGCQGLASIVIPNSVTSIGNNAFSCCYWLVCVDVGNSVTSIGDHAFSYCFRLTSVVIHDSVTRIGYAAFHGCTGLTSIVIPNSVTSIGNNAFEGCTGLTRVDVGNSMSGIGYKAFSSCTGLKSVYCYSSMPPSCSDNCFSDYSATLHVPAASMAAYFTAICWKNFENIIGDAVAPTVLSISKDSINLQQDEQLQLIAIVTPDNASYKEITWMSSDTTVATVNNGMIIAVGCGECNIIASCFGMQVVCHVLVANRITLDQQEAMLLPNHILTLTPTPTMPDIYTVSSSNPTVAAARVLSSGKVQVVGIKEGSTTITVGTADGTAIPATCLITVYTEPGDLNSDGFVNISDVTSLINYLLGDDDSSVTIKNADVNGDGNINISDVTSLINILLNAE